MDEILSKFGSPVETGRDSVLVGFNEAEIEDAFKDLHDTSVSMAELKKKYGLKDTSSWNISKRRENKPHFPPSIVDFLYRPFDKRKAVYSHLIRRDHYENMKHMLQNNLGLLVMRQVVLNAPYLHFLACSNIADRRVFASSQGAASVAPLYLYEEPEEGLFASQSPHPKSLSQRERDFLPPSPSGRRAGDEGIFGRGTGGEGLRRPNFKKGFVEFIGRLRGVENTLRGLIEGRNLPSDQRRNRSYRQVGAFKRPVRGFIA